MSSRLVEPSFFECLAEIKAGEKAKNIGLLELNQTAEAIFNIRVAAYIKEMSMRTIYHHASTSSSSSSSSPFHSSTPITNHFTGKINGDVNINGNSTKSVSLTRTHHYTIFSLFKYTPIQT